MKRTTPKPGMRSRNALVLSLAAAVLGLAIMVYVVPRWWAKHTAEEIALHGFNLLQVAQAPLDSQLAAASLRLLKATGANTVAFVPFMQQTSPAAVDIKIDNAVLDKQLRAGLRVAKQLHLKAIVKPQILVPGSWTGAIVPSNWRQWFDNYARHLIHYAKLAQEEGAFAFIIGTELTHAADQPEWRRLVARIRSVFHGKLSYAAHGIEGIRRFRHWDLLDAVGVTLYPAAARAELKQTITATAMQAKKEAAMRNKPLWLLEIGMPSATDAEKAPWNWQRLQQDGTGMDVDLQADATRAWLKAARLAGAEAVLFWNWTSSPCAGGNGDKNYTVQNKPAEEIIRCRWGGYCT